MVSLNRRKFLATTGAAAGGLLAESLLGRPALAQTRDAIKIGFPIPLTGPFGSIASDMQRGATLAMEELNTKGGVLGRKLEVIFRDDQLKPGVGAQRAKELIENEKIHFMAGVIAAHVQMAVNEQTKQAKMLFFSLSQSEEITAKPDASPYTFHEAMNPTITSQAVGSWTLQNLGKRWWVLYADYAWGKQNLAGFTKVANTRGGTILGSTPYPLGSSDFSAHLPRIQDAKPDVLIAVTPGVDQENSFKQITSFGLKKQMKVVAPLLFLFNRKSAGAEAYAGVYGGTSFYWEMMDTVPSSKRYVEAFMKRFGVPPADYSGYGYSGIMEIARGVELAKSTDSETVAKALRANPVYDHYKGKQWWRACDNKAFQDVYILKARDPDKVKGEWGFFETIDKLPASEEMDRTCAEKGHA